MIGRGERSERGFRERPTLRRVDLAVYFLRETFVSLRRPLAWPGWAELHAISLHEYTIYA